MHFAARLATLIPSRSTRLGLAYADLCDLRGYFSAYNFAHPLRTGNALNKGVTIEDKGKAQAE